MFDWGYNSDVEEGLAGRQLPHLRGKSARRILVGDQCHGNFFRCGHPVDYDRWAANGASGWSYKDVLPYFKRIQKHGRVVKARCAAAPDRSVCSSPPRPIRSSVRCSPCHDPEHASFPPTDDYNGVRSEGFGRAQFSIQERPKRSSASRAYLRPALGRPNLTVRTHALVHRVLLVGGRATGVHFSVDGRMESVEAEREVLLCGGAFNTPQLLMLSGIGPAEHLAALGDRAAHRPAGRGEPPGSSLRPTVRWTRRTPGPFHRLMRFDRAGVAM